MDTKALRQKILDLAIRGKLVPQDPNDEPASALLERIRAEKQQMVKEGKLKAKDIKNDTIIFRGEDNLHYEKFRDGTVKCIEKEIPFEVPEGWEWTRANCVIDVRDGTHDTPVYVENGIPLITSKNLTSVGVDYTNVKYISHEDAIQINQRSGVDVGDILFAMIGTIGNPTLVTKDTLISIKNVALFKFSYSCDMNHLYILRLFENLQEEMKTNPSGGLQPFVSLNRLKMTLMPIAPIKEQARIVENLNVILTRIDTVNYECDKLNGLINSVKSKILDLAIRGQLVPQDPNDEPASILLERIRSKKEELIKQGKIKRDKKKSIIFKGDDNSYYERVDHSIIKLTNEVLFDLPSGWEYVRLKDITIKLVDGSHNPPKGEPFQTEYIMASSRNINDDTIVDLNNVRYISKEQFEKENARTNISENDILLTTVATLGRSCIYKSAPPNLCLQRSVTVITPLIIIPQYLKLFFDSPRFQKLINREATGTAQKGFYLNQLENVIVPIPPLNEQCAVASYASRLIEQLNNIMDVVRE